MKNRDLKQGKLYIPITKIYFYDNTKLVWENTQEIVMFLDLNQYHTRMFYLYKTNLLYNYIDPVHWADLEWFQEII